MIAYRIADARRPIFDSTGALLHGGRWNSIGLRAIYAAQTYAGALLEGLVHSNFSAPPKNHRVVRIIFSDNVAIETISNDKVLYWNAEDMISSRAFGDRWIQESRTAILAVPSVITRGRENNMVFNPNHPDFRLVQVEDPEIVYWERRLFRQEADELFFWYWRSGLNRHDQ